MEPMIRFGTILQTGRPLLLPLSILARHLWIQGMTGGMKTLIATFIACQILKLDPQACVNFCDFGADLFGFNRTRETAAALGREFKFISMSPSDAWHSLDLMKPICPLKYENIPQATNYLQIISGLDHGEGYAKSYYGRQNYARFARTLTDLVDEGIHSPSIEQFARCITTRARRQRLSDTSEAELVAEQLLHYPQLMPSEFADREIDAQHSLKNQEVIYGFLPVVMEPGARLVGSILVWSFVLAAMRRYGTGLPLHRVYIIIDEFPAVAGSKQFADLLPLARKLGVCLIVLTQTSAQLKGRDRDLFPVVWDNTATKIWLTPTDPDDCDILRSISKDVLKSRGSSTTYRDFKSSVSSREVYEPGLERNDIIDTAFTGMEAYCVFNDFKGHHEPIRFRFEPDWNLEEYRRLSAIPLPKRDGTAEHASTSKSETENRTERARRDADDSRRQATLDSLLKLKQAQEEWETSP